MSRSTKALLFAFLAIVALLFTFPASPRRPRQIEPSRIMAYDPPRAYVCYQASARPKIDGRLDDPVWKDAPWSETFVDIEGAAKPHPKYQTRMKMLWDEKYLYIAAELEEPDVWATLVEHDSIIFIDNDFEVFLDPDSDSHNYGELEINAVNATWDLFLSKPYRDGGPALHDWEIHGLRTAVHVDGTLNRADDRDRGWTVEIAWPMKNILEFTPKAFHPKEGVQWRINFSRVEWESRQKNGLYEKVPNRPESNWVWSPQGVIDMHRPSKWGVLQFTTQPPGTVRFQPDPTGPAREALQRVYEAQHAFRKSNGRWAGSLRELNLSLHHPSFVNLWLETTSNEFDASVMVPRPDGKRTKLRIGSDSRVRAETP